MKPVADEPNKTHSNIRVTIQPDGKPSQLDPDLDEKELAAIGWITTHWAILEHYLLYQTVEMAAARGAEAASDAFNLSLSRRFKSWLAEVRLLPDSPRKTQLEKLSGKLPTAKTGVH